MISCTTFTCSRITARDKRKVVWTINGKGYCNVCFLNWMDLNELGKHRIHRLFEDDSLYEDKRPQKRKRKPLTGGLNGSRICSATSHTVQA